MGTDVFAVFRDEFHWMQREAKGLYPWVEGNSWRLLERISGCLCDHPFCRHRGEDGRTLISSLFSTQVLENPLFDIFLKSLIRAEVRFISRFVLQRSHEERLTGNLVSEIDAAIFLVKDAFRSASLGRYGVEKEIDFYYYDLSRGGKLEKQTGADLGFILVVDLPDYHPTVQGVVLQAKKCDSSASIDTRQYHTLRKMSDDASAYLFYDMSFRTLASPMVVKAASLDSRAKESEQKGTKSFSLQMADVLGCGVPLSLYLMHDVIQRRSGSQYQSFEQAFSCFRRLAPDGDAPDGFNGRLAIASLGRAISIHPNSDGGLEVSV